MEITLLSLHQTGKKKKKKKNNIDLLSTFASFAQRSIRKIRRSAMGKKLFKVRQFSLLLNIQRLLTGLNHKVQSPEYIIAQMDRGDSKWLQEHSVLNAVTGLPCVNWLKSHVPVYVEAVAL